MLVSHSLKLKRLGPATKEGFFVFFCFILYARYYVLEEWIALQMLAQILGSSVLLLCKVKLR